MQQSALHRAFAIVRSVRRTRVHDFLPSICLDARELHAARSHSADRTRRCLSSDNSQQRRAVHARPARVCVPVSLSADAHTEHPPHSDDIRIDMNFMHTNTKLN